MSPACPTTDSAFDNHFSEITLPVLYIGGGFGLLGPYVSQVVGSTDVTQIMAQLQPDDNEVESRNVLIPSLIDE